MSLLRLLRSHLLGPYAKTLLLVVLFQTIQTIAALTLPALSADIIDEGVLVGDNEFIRRTGVVMLGFTLIQVVFNVLAVWYGARAAMGFGRDLRRDLFHQVTDYSAREVGRFGAPSLITRVTNDVQQVQTLVVLACTMMIAAPLTLIFGVIMAVRQDVGLSIVLVVSIPLTVILLGSVVARMVPAFQAMQDRIDRVNHVLRDQITGVRVVRAFVREPEEEARFALANDELTDVSLRAGRLMAAMFPIIMFSINAASIAVIWLGASRIDDGSLQLGTLIAYLSYLILILQSVVMATFLVSMIPRATVSGERVEEVLETEPTVVAAPNAATEVAEVGTVEFRDVGFHYPGAEHSVLSHIDLRVEAGQTLAVIGSTGAGKSTLVKLVPRLFDATSGAVLVDGVDVRELHPDLLWSKIGYVPQKPYLFTGTVASNLRFGTPDASEKEMWRALEIAQAADFVATMPAGLDSQISQGGANVSGGQRQRLAIARAIVVRPEIYVFDDSFSALDLVTDARLRAALRPAASAAAVIVVAQRVSSIMGADRILVLDDGELVGAGTHDELLGECPTYIEIVESQIGEVAA